MFSLARGADTVFIARHWFSGPVHNVFDNGSGVFVKAGRSLFKWEDGSWEKQDLESDKFFVFYDKGFYETDFLPDVKAENLTSMAYLIPQANLLNGTVARLGNELFVAVGGALYQYRVDKNFVRTYPGKSIRHVFKSADLEVISTYQGIYVNTGNGPRKARGVEYSNGKFWPTHEGKFLLNDELLAFVPPDSFRRINLEIPVKLGKTRKGVSYRDSLIIQMTTSICYFDTATGFTPLHSGFEYRDIEVYGDKLLFVTSSGEFFSYNKGTITVHHNLRTQIRDLYIGNKGIFLCTDKGVYAMKDLDAEPQMFAPLVKAAAMVEDNSLNAWISTDYGLYVVPKGTNNLIPFLPNIEFNWGALEFTRDTIFAGSLQGLYAVDYYQFTKTFLPEAMNRLNQEATKGRIKIYGVLILLLAMFAFIYFLVRIRRNRRVLIPEQQQKNYLSLERIRTDIIEHNLLSVEALAGFYGTNPVQMNRIFKNFDTTPGRFLKKVKMDLAREMLQNGASLADIASKTGYSAHFLKSELK